MPKKEFVREMFDGISGSYDRLNHLMSADVDKSWRRKAIREIACGFPKGEKMKLLDLACGTGDFSIAAARMIPAAEVTGLDLSSGMLDVMKTKVQSASLGDRISMVLGDGEDLPFPDGTFDRVAIAFGIRNFENRERGLREMLRVLKPGGRLVVLELSVPENPLVRSLYSFYFTKVMPAVGGVVSGDRKAYEYLPASVLNFPKKDEFLAIMRSCGFRDASHRALSLGICRMYRGGK